MPKADPAARRGGAAAAGGRFAAPALPPGFTLLHGAITEPDARLGELVATLPWEDHVFRIFGRAVPMPRRIAWFGDVPYAYSGVVHPAAPMPPPVQAIRAEIRGVTGLDFNTVLVNLYRDGADSMGWHADDDYAPRVTTAIASVSLGAARPFLLRARSGEPPARASVVLPHGSLLVMGEGTQRAWHHALPKRSGAVGLRVNLTFRDMAGGCASSGAAGAPMERGRAADPSAGAGPRRAGSGPAREG